LQCQQFIVPIVNQKNIGAIIGDPQASATLVHQFWLFGHMYKGNRVCRGFEG
jgi:hypothetical protein